MTETKLAIDDKDAELHFIAMRWDADVSSWRMVSLGRDLDEIDERVAHWKGNGITGIQIYSMQRFPDKRGPQGIEGGLPPIVGGLAS